MVHQKRLSAPKHYPIERKGLTYTTTVEGSRGPETGIPSVVFLREVTGYAETKKEAKKIIREGSLHRNGSRVGDVRDSIGILDLVKIPETGEAFRVMPKKDRIDFIKTEDERTSAKITGKKVEDKEYVYHLHNGENHQTTEQYPTGTTLLLKDGEIEEAAEIEEGTEVIILDGQHAGQKAEIKELHARGMNPDTATVETADSEFEIRQEKLFATGSLEVEQ